MKKPNKHSKQPEVRRRLSPWRLMFLLLIILGLIGSGVSVVSKWRIGKSTKTQSPWFASYIDVTATPTYAFDQGDKDSINDAILSFVVSLISEPCTPSWGSVYTLDEARESIDLDRRIAQLQKQDGNVAISFGGKANQELAVGCTDQEKLLEAYRSVTDRYNVDTIDLDLEGEGLKDSAASNRRATAIAKLQSERREKGKSLAVWATLPVTTEGLGIDGTNAVARLLGNGVDLAGVNAMTMAFGQSKDEGQTMSAASESALTRTQNQLGVLYKRQGFHLNNDTLWSKIGATPMIGQNDDVGQIFTLEDAKELNNFAISHKIGRMSMWSGNRDRACGSSYTNTKIVSYSCSGVTQDKYGFAKILSKDFKGRLSNNASIVTKADADNTEQTPDDPATSPYEIWSESAAYLKNTKVVWHRNVYKAKWWTQGDIPDNAALHSWETPWELIGPVLPGEKPIRQFTLPKGTYPDWSGTAIYKAGQRVLFNKVPYQAKWWNQGESPAASSSDPNNSPWTRLTKQQVQKSKIDKKKISL